MKRHDLKVEKRTVTGKNVKKLRRDGILPGNVYGRDFKSTSVQVPLDSFNSVYKEAGETGLVDLKLDAATIPVLIHNVASDYKRTVLHADFYKVNLKEKVKAMIPLEFVGEPKAVVDKIGLLEKLLNEVEVEALPTDLPEHIEVSVESLAQIDDQITAGDLKKPEGVEILTDPGQVVAKIGELITKEAQAEAQAEAAAAEAAKTEAAEAAGEEGAAPAEGAEAPAEGEAKPEEAGGKEAAKADLPAGRQEQKPAEAPKEEAK